MKAGWQTIRFGEVCDLKKGKKPTLQSAGAEGVKPYLVAKYLRGAEPTEFASISDRNSVSVSSNEIIIICDGSNSGETFIGFEGILSSTMAKIGHGNEIDNRFLMHFLDSLFEKFNAGKTGAAIPHLDLAALRDEILPMPDVEEQHRIVAILDEAFDGIATAKANAEKNLQNARALFESHLQSVFSERGEGLKNSELGAVCVFSQGIQVDVKHQSESKKGDDQVRFLRIVDFTQGGEPPRYIDNPGAKFIVVASDIALVRYGASTGFVCRGLDGAIANNLFRVIPNDSLLTTEYLYWFLKSPLFQDKIKRKMNGAAMPAISFGMIKDINLPMSSFADQARVVSMLNELAFEVSRLESIYLRKLTALDDLKKSLLHQAFSGQL